MKILVSISVPAILESHDILIPAELKVNSIIPMIAHAIEEISNGRYVSSGEEYLCSVENNIRINQFSTLAESGIRNGDHLVLL